MIEEIKVWFTALMLTAHLVESQQLLPERHEFNVLVAVADALHELRSNQADRLRVVQLEPARQALLRERADLPNERKTRVRAQACKSLFAPDNVLCQKRSQKERHNRR